MTKVGYDKLGIKLRKNVTHSLEVLHLRYSLKGAKALSFVRSSSSREVAKEKTGEYVRDETVYLEHHRQESKLLPVTAKALKTNTHVEDRKWLAKYVVQGITLIV